MSEMYCTVPRLVYHYQIVLYLPVIVQMKLTDVISCADLIKIVLILFLVYMKLTQLK